MANVNATSKDLGNEDMLSTDMENVLLGSPTKSTNDGSNTDSTGTEYNDLPTSLSTFPQQRGEFIISIYPLNKT